MNLKRLSAWSLVLSVPVWLAAQQMEAFTCKLKNRDVRSVMARVTEELGPSGKIAVDGATNRITVTDESGRVLAIRRLLSELDQPAKRFALSARLDVLSRPQEKALFKPTPAFVDMTEWARDTAPVASYDCVADVAEGQRSSCALGKGYRLEAEAEGYDPSRKRLGLRSLTLLRLEAGKPDAAVLRGAAVLPVGDPTVLFVRPTDQAPPLRLKITPTLLPSVDQREVR
jgi:hypothetical protein